MIFRALAVVVAISNAHPQSRAITMSDLTVPNERLPVECGPTPPNAKSGTSPTQVPGIMANPWTGTDVTALAWIRQRMEGAPQVPDGPPLDRRAAARYVLRWAEGIEEGYAASYTDGGQHLVVHALRFAERSRDIPAKLGTSTARVDIRPIVAFIYGNDSDCFQTVVAHLRSLGK